VILTHAILNVNVIEHTALTGHQAQYSETQFFSPRSFKDITTVKRLDFMTEVLAPTQTSWGREYEHSRF
jgi:hypothetical protein